MCIPPFTSPFVQIADIESVVIVVTHADNKMIAEISKTPV